MFLCMFSSWRAEATGCFSIQEETLRNAPIQKGCGVKYPRKMEMIPWNESILERLFQRKTLKHLKKFQMGISPPTQKLQILFILSGSSWLYTARCGYTTGSWPLPKCKQLFNKTSGPKGTLSPLSLQTSFRQPVSSSWEQMPGLAQSTNTQRTNTDELRTLQPQKLSEGFGGALTFS